MGAAMATTLLLYHEQMGIPEVPFRFAILLCGTLPCDWMALQKGKLEFLDPTQMTRFVQIPTVNFWSPEDDEHPGQSRKVVKMCEERLRVDLTHGAGHALPTNLGKVLELAQAIRAVSNS